MFLQCAQYFLLLCFHPFRITPLIILYKVLFNLELASSLCWPANRQHSLHIYYVISKRVELQYIVQLSEIQIDKCDKANVSTPCSAKRYNDKIWNVNDDPRGTISPRQSRDSLGPPVLPPPLPSAVGVGRAAGCFSMSDPIRLLTAVDKFLCSSAGSVCGNDLTQFVSLSFFSLGNAY